MDKHERKRLAQWESKKGKETLKMEDRLRKHSYDYVCRHVAHMVSEWEPAHATLFPEALTMLQKPQVRTLILHNIDYTDDEIENLVLGYRWMGSRRYRFYMADEEIAAEIAEEKSWKEQTRRFQLAFALRRHQLRVETIRDELEGVTRRFRANQNCRLIKEELMMEAWHPRRVEHILTTYGWEAYENLLGM